MAVRQHRVEERRAGRAVDPRVQRRSHEAEIALADIEPGPERPAGVGIHIGDEHLGERAAVQHHPVTVAVAVLHQ